MSVHRVYLPNLTAETVRLGDEIPVTGDEAAHAVRVKRIGVDDIVEVLNGKGLRVVGRTVAVSKPVLTLRVESVDEQTRPTPAIIIAAPAPKGDRADTLVEQISQLGAARWIPLRTQRSVADPKPRKLEKWRRAAIESAKQCGRAWLLEIDEPTALDRLLLETSTPLLIADVGAEGFRAPRVDRFVILIGPEGGFTDDEAEAIFRAGATPVNLGPHTLRIETACAAAVAAANVTRD